MTVSAPAAIVSEACEMNPTKRNSMEDVHRVQVSWCPKQLSSLENHQIVNGGQTYKFTDCHYVGVYDGHGGRGIVDFIERRLESNMVEEVGAVFESKGAGAKADVKARSHLMSAPSNENLHANILAPTERAGSPHASSQATSTNQNEIMIDDLGVLNAMEKSYLITDMASSRAQIRTSGSTVVTVLMMRYESPSGGVMHKIYCANAGDARAILCTKPRTKSEGKGFDRGAKVDDAEPLAQDRGEGGYKVTR